MEGMSPVRGEPPLPDPDVLLPGVPWPDDPLFDEPLRAALNEGAMAWFGRDEIGPFTWPVSRPAGP
jgi:hypothetical protein